MSFLGAPVPMTLQTKVDPCGMRGAFGECFPLFKSELGCPANHSVQNGLCFPETTLPILETKVEPCGSKGLFGECFPLIKTQAVCPPGRFLKDGLCHTNPNSVTLGGAAKPGRNGGIKM